MLQLGRPLPYKVRNLILISLIFHGLLFLGVMDIYCFSPVEKGLSPHKSETHPLAKRVVIFVSDGIQAVDIYPNESDYRAPYLTHVRYNYAAWGTASTEVPPESRPGHISIFSGTYDDPSVITKDRLNNALDFDHVFNHSTNSWLWGNANIITLFNRGNFSKIRTYYYKKHIEEFLKQKSVNDFDGWIFEDVRNLFAARNQSSCDDLCDNGNIFFIHFVGTDVSRHAQNVGSKYFMENIKFVDSRLRKIAKVIDDFFQDNQTTYIFTSDHGYDTAFDTEAPFLIWGSGVRKQEIKKRVMQADVAPLISVILGINIPVNSMGMVPDEYLALTDKERALILYANALQLGEQFFIKGKNIEENSILLFYEFFHKITIRHYLDHVTIIKYHLDMGYYHEAIGEARHLIQLLQEGLVYFKSYYKLPLFICMVVSIVLWIIYYGMHVPELYERDQDRMFTTYLPMVLFHNIIDLEMIILAFISIIWIFFYLAQVKLKYYIFFALPLLILMFIVYEINQLIYCILLMLKHGLLRTIGKAVMYLVGIEILVLTFFHRSSILLILVGLVFWVITQVHGSRNDRNVWISLSFATTTYILLPNLSIDYNFTITIMVLAAYAYNILAKLSNEIIQFRWITSTYRLLYIFVVLLQFNVVIIAAIILLTVGVLFEQNIAIPLYIIALSWSVFSMALVLIHMSPNLIVSRLFALLNSIVTIYALMCFSYEGVFLMVFIYLMHEWARLEFSLVWRKMDNFAFLRFSEETIIKRPCNAEDFRKAFFFLTFVLISYFATENMPNMYTFNPIWIKCFVSGFDPLLTSFLLLIKISIPIFITTVFFRLIAQVTSGSLIKSFTIVLLYCDVMILHFMFLLENDGPWLEIGLSISRLGVMLAITILLIVFYVLAYFMTCSPYYDFIYYKFIGQQNFPQPNRSDFV